MNNKMYNMWEDEASMINQMINQQKLEREKEPDEPKEY